MEQAVIQDLLIRGASLGVLLLLLARFLLHRPIRFVELTLICLLISILFYVFVSAPIQLINNDTLWRVISYIPTVAPFFLWWAGLAFFDDEFKARPWHALLALVVIAPVFFSRILPELEWVRRLAVFLLYGHLVYTLLKNRAADLVETRRQFRHWFVFLTVLFGAVSEVFETSSVEHQIPSQSAPYQAIAVFLLAIAFAFWALRIDRANWQAKPETKRKTPTAPKDTHLLARLKLAMNDGIWREEGLAVGGLARHLDVPEHQLRRAINQGLGYRNFSTFVNERRIKEACALLADSQKMQVPVLSIAYEVGFSSIGPFNRAFRSFMGESPTAFRAKNLT